MPRQVPGIISNGKAASREAARTQVLARAFDDVANDYFDRKQQYEDTIEAAEERQRTMLIGAVIAVVLGVGIAAIAGDSTSVVIGLLVAVVGGGAAAWQWQQAGNKVDETRRKMETDEPDGEVTFVSQIGVPMYLLPYDEGHMIFDGLGAAPSTELTLANLDGDSLLDRQRNLTQQKRTYDEHFADQTIVAPEVLRQFAPEIGDHGRPEQPIVDEIEAMSEIARDTEVDTVEVSVWANDQKSRSLKELTNEELLRDGEVSTLDPQRTPEEYRAVVDDIRGVEEEAVSGDMLDQAQQSRELVDGLASDLEDRLRDNESRVEDHYEAYSDTVERTEVKYVCEDCLESRVRSIVDELGLVDEILSSETGSLGTALSDPDLNRATDEEFTQRIREDIAAEIPEMDEELKRAFNRLTHLRSDSGHCETHGDVDTVAVADGGELFGEVWRSLYYAFREPILNSVEDMEQDAEQIRQQKEQKMMDLTQFEQIKDEAEHRYRETQAEYAAAKAVERSL